MGWIAMVAARPCSPAPACFVFVRRDTGALQFTAAALLLALAGYAWQGHPGMAGAPKAAPGRQQLPDSDFAKTREDMLGRFDRAWAWLTIADGFQRRGDTRSAAELLQSAVRRNPRQCRPLGRLRQRSGHAWRRHDEPGRPARLPARRRARPRPSRRRASSTASRSRKGGNYDAAERIWRELLANAPPDAQYRRIVEERLQALEQARASGQIPVAAPPP